ncbi:hypothetical protein K1T71_012134 [Dendrolimus kikuchii]|uniref:Uncharacterized protein n=1 Tax=Dendrolimus kikuchii TaxID=765133 RepID=A0ACC1CL39_9NEOP|nr:hypothetical protein K1T71_012134 [Dendrolimus kikuchii]
MEYCGPLSSKKLLVVMPLNEYYRPIGMNHSQISRGPIRRPAACRQRSVDCPGGRQRIRTNETQTSPRKHATVFTIPVHIGQTRKLPLVHCENFGLYSHFEQGTLTGLHLDSSCIYC